MIRMELVVAQSYYDDVVAFEAVAWTLALAADDEERMHRRLALIPLFYILLSTQTLGVTAIASGHSPSNERRDASLVPWWTARWKLQSVELKSFYWLHIKFLAHRAHLTHSTIVRRFIFRTTMKFHLNTFRLNTVQHLHGVSHCLQQNVPKRRRTNNVEENWTRKINLSVTHLIRS
jgi:hypothetical protein